MGKLLCDEMLGRLGRWLRAAGYDTAIAAQGLPDAALLKCCAIEGRTLLTRDRHLAGVAQGRVPVLLIAENDIAAQAQRLRHALAVDWLHAPFTRCLVDNTALAPAPPDRAAQVLPPASRG